MVCTIGKSATEDVAGLSFLFKFVTKWLRILNIIHLVVKSKKKIEILNKTVKETYGTVLGECIFFLLL